MNKIKNLSVPAQHLIELCYDEDQPMATSFIIGEKYEIKNKKYLYDESLYNELVKYKEEGAISFRLIKSGNIVNMSGIRKNK